MAKTIADLLKAADTEWKHWGSSTWNLSTGKANIGHIDDELKFAKYVIENYNAVGGGKPTPSDIAKDKYPWSAVGMSYVFHEADFKKAEFPFAQSHSVWLRKFIKARKSGTANALYHGYRLTEAGASPQVGDLVAYVREAGTFDDAQKYFDVTTAYMSHSDLVVERRHNEIDVVGFNVLDSVTKKTIPLDNNGFIADRKHKWFVVLRAKALS